MNECITDNRFDLVLIKHQDISPIMDSKVQKQLKEIMYSSSKTKCIDAYLLGFMHGKRAERAKKKAK